MIDPNKTDKQELVRLLSLEGHELDELFQYSGQVKLKNIGNKVYYRGLIEYSNRCAKNCYYCGVRRDNQGLPRYTVSDEEVLQAALLAHRKKFGSLVLQSGERSDKYFVKKIGEVLQAIHRATGNSLHITLSMGEQSEATYRYWRECGAHRYLLRIETSNRELYHKIHPNDELHSFEKRIEALELLKKTGYQTGTGVMCGLPFQTLDDLADDLLFIKNLDVDMVGLGPYVEHEATPLWQYRNQLLPTEKRFELSLKLVAILRILMPKINIAATTAMQTLHPQGRELALKIGANVMMPNLTPLKYREGYLLYQNKPGTDEDTDASLARLQQAIEGAGCIAAYGEWGDSLHYAHRTGKD
jgi:biotin synthase